MKRLVKLNKDRWTMTSYSPPPCTFSSIWIMRNLPGIALQLETYLYIQMLLISSISYTSWWYDTEPFIFIITYIFCYKYNIIFLSLLFFCVGGAYAYWFWHEQITNVALKTPAFCNIMNIFVQNCVFMNHRICVQGDQNSSNILYTKVLPILMWIGITTLIYNVS